MRYLRPACISDPIRIFLRPLVWEPVGVRLTCSLQTNLKDMAQKCVEATKIASFALATFALVVSGGSAKGVPKRLTIDEIQSKTYMEVKGTEAAN